MKKLFGRTQDKTKAILETIEDGYYELDLAGNFTFFNDALCRMHGRSREELTGLNFRQYMDEENIKILFQAYNRVFQTGIPNRELGLLVRRKDGTAIYVEISISLQKNSLGKPVGFRGIVRDVTERRKAEDELRESEELFRNYLELAPDGVYMSDLKGNFLYGNRKCEEIIGYRREELIGRNFLELNLLTEKGINKAVQWLQANIEGKSTDPDEIELTRKDGRIIPVEINTSVVQRRGQKIVLAFVRDITERRKAVEEIIKLASVVKFSSELVNLATPEGKMIFLNEAGSRMLGIEPDNVGAYSITDVISEPFLPTVHQEILPALLSGNSWEGELQYRNLRTGELTDVYSVTFNIRDDVTGATLCLANVSHNITGRKQTETLLRTSEEKYRLLADHIKDMVWLSDLDLNINYISPSVEKELGYTLEEVQSLPLDKLLTSSSYRAAMDFFAEEIEKALAAPGNYVLKRTLELEFIRKDGKTLWEECRFSFIRDEEGKPLSILGESSDITERKQMEDELRASESNFHHSLNESPLGVRISTIEGETIYANQAILDIYGYDSIDQLKNASLKERYTPESYAQWQARKELRLRGESGPSEYEISIVTKSGEVRHLYVFRKAIFWNGRVQSQVTYQDITLRKKAEEKLNRTLENLRQAIKTTIQVLGLASEARDPYTAGHHRRVSCLARDIARERGLSHHMIEGIRMAGSIHDIGKLSVPAEILSKPTKLTELEFSLIKEHAQSGYEMLKNVESPWPLADIVYQHHERMNGTGYPRNLQEDEILMAARVMAVADVVEAMSSHRPYRASLGIEAALEEIERNRGTLYDADIVDACLRLFREKGYKLA